MKSNDSKKRKSGFNPNRTCYLTADGKYYCYERWDDDAKRMVTQRLEVGKDLSLELTLILDDSDHDMDLQDRYEGELRDPLFDAKVSSYKTDPDNEDAVDPWGMIADKGGSPEDVMFAEPEPENPQKAQVRRVIDDECTEAQHYIYLVCKGTVNRKVLYALRQKLNLAKMLVDNYRQGRNSLMDIAKDDYARFNSNTYLEVYEDIQAKSKKLYRDEVAAHDRTRERLRKLEVSSADKKRKSEQEIKALSDRIVSMEEREKKRQEREFDKKASRLGWVATLVLVGLPYLFCAVGIEIIKTQFSDVTWRSAYGIAGAIIATAIAEVLFAKGKKWCFKKVRSILGKHK